MILESEPGVDMRNPDELTHYHFSGISTPIGARGTQGLCSEPVPIDSTETDWVKDTILGDTARRIKDCAFDNRLVRT